MSSEPTVVPTPSSTPSTPSTPDASFIKSITTPSNSVNLDTPIVLNGKAYTAAEMASIIQESQSLKARVTELEPLGELQKTVARMYGPSDEPLPLESVKENYRRLLLNAGWSEGDQLDSTVNEYVEALVPTKTEPTKQDRPTPPAPQATPTWAVELVEQRLQDNVEKALEGSPDFKRLFDSMKNSRGDEAVTKARQAALKKIDRQMRSALGKRQQLEGKPLSFEWVPQALNQAVADVFGEIIEFSALNPTEIGKVPGAYAQNPFEDYTATRKPKPIEKLGVAPMDQDLASIEEVADHALMEALAKNPI